MTDRIWRRSAVESHGCPFRYNKLQNEGIDDTGDEAIRGRAFHAAAWVYVMRLARKGLQADHEEAVAAFGEGLSVTGIPDHLISKVQKLFFAWAERFELDVDAFLAAEEIERVARREFRPDLVYCRPGELEIVDFKTYFRGLTETQAAEELQLRWYLVQAVKTWPGFARYRFTYEFVRINARVSLSFTAEEIAEFEPGVQAAIDAVTASEERGEYPPIPGSHCALCRLVCPVADAADRMPLRIMSTEQRDEIAGQILAGRQRLKQLTDLLKRHVEVEGGFTYGGTVFAYWPGVKVEYPAAEVLSWCHDRRIDTSGVRLSKSGLGDLAKPRKAPEGLADELERLASKRETWTFRAKKRGDDLPEGVADLLSDDEGGDDADGEP